MSRASARAGAPLLPLLVLAAILAAFPLLMGNPFFLNIGINVCISATVCVGLNLLSGHAGQISLGHAGFFGLGAYGAALLTTRAGLPPLLAVLATSVGVGVLAFVAARPILRLRGHYLAVATLGLGIIISIVLNREVWLTAGPDGLTIPAITAFGVRLRSQPLWYGIAAGALLVTVWLAENLIHSPAGRALAALNSSEIAAATSGIDVARAKALVFTLSAVIACIGGAIFVFAGRFVTPADASFLKSVEFVTMIVLGGLASSYGAIVGAAVLTALPQIFAPLADYTTIVLGLVLVVVMIVLPRGVFPTLADKLRRRRRPA
jgi:branched-chain amino acid transport system permease protein